MRSQRIRFLLFTILFCVIMWPERIYAVVSDRPFIDPSVTGITGLMEIPTARILEDGYMRLGVSHIYPFRTYYFGLGFLPGLEVNGRVTEVLNQVETGPLWEGYGHTKIREFDVKYQIFPESRYFPAIAVGANDIYGDNITFSAKYLVFSRQIYPFDLTLGYGFGRIRGPFGGLELKLFKDQLSLMVEYNPMDYSKDRLRGGVKDQPDFPRIGFYSPRKWKFDPGRINVGIRIKPLKWLRVEGSFQRGNTFGISISSDFLLGGKLLPPAPDEPYTSPVDMRPLSERSPFTVTSTIAEALVNQGFGGVRVYIIKDRLYAEYENVRYLSEAKAMGRVMRTVAALAPSDIPKVTVIAKRRTVPVLELTFEVADFLGFLSGHYSKEDFRRLIELKVARGIDIGTIRKRAKRLGTSNFIRSFFRPALLSYGIKPAFDTWLDDPSGFFKIRLGVDAWASASLWDGSLFFGWLNVPAYNTIESRVAPLGESPVRSDIVRYKERDEPRLNTLVFDQVMNLGRRTFGRFTLGYIETEYAGISAEVFRWLWDGRLSVGIMGDWVRKRDPVHPFILEDFSAYSVLGGVNYFMPGLGLATKLRFGRFLGGDPGVKLEVARRFRRGAIFGFWYTYTDTSVFDNPFNRGYRDKGIFISFPLRMFLREDSPIRYTYAFSPWTRDVGQTIGHFNLLYEFLEDLIPANILERLEEMKE